MNQSLDAYTSASIIHAIGCYIQLLFIQKFYFIWILCIMSIFLTINQPYYYVYNVYVFIIYLPVCTQLCDNSPHKIYVHICLNVLYTFIFICSMKCRYFKYNFIDQMFLFRLLMIYSVLYSSHFNGCDYLN